MKEINKTKAKNESLHEMLKSIFLSVNLNGVKKILSTSQMAPSH